MKKNSKGILLVSGCSYTDDNWSSNMSSLPDYYRGMKDKDGNSWPKWPTILGEKLGLDVVNLAKGGKGNNYIFETLIDGIHEYGDRVKLVCPLWAQWDRFSFGLHYLNFDYLFPPSPTANALRSLGFTDKNFYEYENYIDISRGAQQELVDRNLMYAYTLHALCEKSGIPNLCASWPVLQLQSIRNFCKSKYFNLIENAHFQI